MHKSIPKLIGKIDRPIIIVGEKPGYQHKGKESPYSLEGNRTGDFVAEAIGNSTNIILTNVVNELYTGNFDHTHENVAVGLHELYELFKKYNPSKIICLGVIAERYVYEMAGEMKLNAVLVKFPHPSWINRFRSKYRSEYIHQLKKHIDETYKRVRPN